MKTEQRLSRVLLGAIVLLLAIGTAAARAETPEELWHKGDYKAAAATIAESKSADHYDTWKELFRKQGQLRVLLDAVIEANPKDALARLERLDLEGDPLGAKSTGELEELLKPDAERPFSGGKGGPRNETRFRGCLDLAYRLMRLYERQDQADKILSLASRVARGDKPFRDWWSRGGDSLRDGNGEWEDANACLALAIQNASSNALAELDKCLPNTVLLPGRMQLNRRLGKGWPQAIWKPVGWANLPKGVSAWVCNDAVLSIAYDDKYVYAGMPWGIMVYSISGEPVTRVALGDAAYQVAIQGSNLWAATPEKLFRIQRDTWQVASLALKSLSVYFRDSVLWIGTPDSIVRLDPSNNEMKTYRVSMRAERFSYAETSLWCQGDWMRSSAHFDSQNDRWEMLLYDGKPVRLITCADGILWGETQIDEKLGVRPCIIDGETFKVTPVLIEDAAPYAKEHRDAASNGFYYRGVWDGKAVINDYYYDARKGVLRALPGDARVQYPDTPRRRFPMSVDEDRLGFLRAELTMPDGTGLCAFSPNYGSGYHFPESESGSENDVEETQGGLYLIPTGKPALRISSFMAADSLPGDMVTGLGFGPAVQWVYTCRGVAAFNDEKGVFAYFRESEGLCANRVLGAICMGPRTYFATGYGDNGGGLAIYDERSRVFTSLFRADGLASDKLAGVERDGANVRLQYGVEYLRFHNGKYRSFPPGVFDPQSGTVAGGGPSQEIPQPSRRTPERKKMPFLGGFVASEQKSGDKTYLCGTRGLVIVEDAAVARDALTTAQLEPHAIQSATNSPVNNACGLPMRIRSPEEAERYLSDPNRRVRMETLEWLPRVCMPDKAPPSRWKAPIMIAEEYEPVVLRALHDPDEKVREAALYWLSWLPDSPAGTSALKERLADSDLAIRATAAVELTRRGERIDEKLLRLLLEQDFSGYTLASKGSCASKKDLYGNLARIADTNLFKLLVEFPPNQDNDFKQTVFPALGAALLRHPDAVDILLHAPEGGGTNRMSSQEFAATVFGFAGKTILPALCQAITGSEPSVRSTAAAGCGEMDDPSAVDCLARGMQFKDRKTREAIAAALIHSKQEASVPLLVKLFMQCDADATPMRKRCDEIYATMEINDPANEEKRKAIDQEREKTLFPEEITRRLYNNKAQEFYRLLAKEESALGKRLAVEKLGEASSEDVTKNCPVLCNLLNDSDSYVSTEAAVSLVLLNDETGRKAFVDVLQKANERDLGTAFARLQRIKKPVSLEFARPQLEAIGGNARLSEAVRLEAMRLLGSK